MNQDLIFFVAVAITVAVGVSISKQPRHFLLALGLITIPWQGGLWFSFCMVDLGIAYTVFFLLLIHIYLFGSKLKRKERFYTPIIYPALAIIFWALLSTLLKAYDIHYGLKGVFFFTMNLILFYCLVNTIKTPGDVEYFVKWYAVALLFQSIVAVLQFTDIIFKIPVIGEVRAGEMLWRKSGTFLHPNQCGMYHMIMLPLMLRMILGSIINKDRKNIIFYTFVVLMGLLGIYTTYNRGSWIGLAFGILVMLGYQSFRKGNKKIKRALSIIAVAGIFVFIIFFAKYGATLTERLFKSDVEGIKEGRFELQDASYDIIKANLILGVAPLNYCFHATSVIFVHNLYLLITAENGVIGLLFFLWFLFAFFREILRGMKSKIIFISNISYGLFASFLGFIFASYPGPDYFISHSVGMNIWALAALAVVLNRLDGKIKLELKKKKITEVELKELSTAPVITQKVSFF